MGESWKRVGERRWRMEKAARMWGTAGMEGITCVWGAARLYGEWKSHESREYEDRVRPADFADFWQYRGRFLGMGIATSTEATPESATVGIVMLGVPATALPGGSRPAGACRRAPPQEITETPSVPRPCVELPRRARHWISYGPSEQSKRAPQLGQRS